MLTAKLEKMKSVGQEYDDNASYDIITTTAYFRNEGKPIINNDDSNIQVAIDTIQKHLEEFTREGSGWRLKRVVALDLGIARYQPFRGRSYFKTLYYIPKRAVINVKNYDNRCFMWSLLSALYQPKNRNVDRTSEYRNHINKLRFDGFFLAFLAAGHL